jgi:hypothetical protein
MGSAKTSTMGLAPGKAEISTRLTSTSPLLPAPPATGSLDTIIVRNRRYLVEDGGINRSSVSQRVVRSSSPASGGGER